MGGVWRAFFQIGIVSDISEQVNVSFVRLEYVERKIDEAGTGFGVCGVREPCYAFLEPWR